MSTTGVAVITSVAMIGAVWLVMSGWRQPRPSLAHAARHLNRRIAPVGHVGEPDDGIVGRIGSMGLRVPFVDAHVRSDQALRLIGRSRQVHVGYLVLAAFIGLAIPSLTLGVLSRAGLVSIDWFVPAALSIALAVLAPLLVHSATVAAADDVRVDVRHQLSSYLDMVTMLLAGNTGHEGALEQAAATGDGLLFRELRRRMREVAATGTSLVGALHLVADDLDLVELEQVAATTELSAAEGAPVARTLAAKCATLRSTLAADQEAKARIRNDKITPPLVGMALLFMAVIIYPALNL